MNIPARAALSLDTDPLFRAITDAAHAWKPTNTCIEFRAPGDRGEPKPRPEPPHMDGLFERPERGTRMFVQPLHTINLAERP